MQHSHSRDFSHADADTLTVAERLVISFGDFLLRHDRQNVSDARLLPAAKSVLEAAFRLTIATEPSEAVRQRLIAEGETLANFQPNVSTPIVLSPCQKSASTTAESHEGHPIEIVMSRVERDARRLRQLFQWAEADARMRFRDNEPVQPPIYDDGTYGFIRGLN